MAKGPQSPIHRQYLRIKERYPHCILFFRLGDFYETFNEDAEVAARELEIALTSRELTKGSRIPMAGIPAHALESYLGRLLAKGYRVAICEQVGEPSKSGPMEREVVRVVTPGTVVEPALLEGQRNNYLAAIWPDSGGELVGLAYADITTSEFVALEVPHDRLATELARLQPAELLYPKLSHASEEGHEVSFDGHIPTTTAVPPEWAHGATETVLDHFGAAVLDGLGLSGRPAAQCAVALVLRYLAENQRQALHQLTRLSVAATEEVMPLDAHTVRNLELFQPQRPGSTSPSLYTLLNQTRTSMGARLLRQWLGQPLLDLARLRERQEAVAALVADGLLRARVREALGDIGDLERLVNRVRSLLATPRELVALRRSLEALPALREALETAGGGGSSLAGLLASLWPAPELAHTLREALVDDPPSTLAEGGVIRPGYAPELDELRQAASEGRSFVASLERAERERTGIRSLKVGYNRVFGYYIEVSKAHLGLVPPDYIRKQTVTTGERFYTPVLKEYEAQILNAEEQSIELESRLFRQLCAQVAAVAERLLETARAVARLDVFAALAEVAVRYRYCRPQLNEGETIRIRAGRHPLVERALPEGSFVPNDAYLANHDAQVLLLTGPNMAGKSTYLRQVALIVLMAQIGSFVPADEAEIGLVDRIFSRIGAQDDLASGQSTFMVEMVETAQILHQATPRSLVILDEIGRGTSTYDGMAIARAVVEYLHNHPRIGAKTLFATHYHELTALAETLPRVRNYHVAVAEEDGRIVFRYQVLPGGANRSYGIHVAQLAGLPRPVVERATKVLQELERAQRDAVLSRRRPKPAAAQLPLFGSAGSPLLEELLALDIETMTPLEALNTLYRLQQKARREHTPSGA